MKKNSVKLILFSFFYFLKYVIIINRYVGVSMYFLIWLAVLPSIVIALLIYRADKKEKEPKKELVKAFLLGIVSVFLTLFLSYIFRINKIDISSHDLTKIAIYSFLGISLIEEFSKWFFSCCFLTNNKNFNYLFDGIVYTTFVSLGFATIENILYTFAGGIFTVLIRAITTVPAHAFFGISSGYFLSLAKQAKISSNSSKKYMYIFLSLFIPFLLHGFYDFCLLTQNYLFFIIYLIFVVALYVMSIYQVKKMMRLETSFIKEKISYCKYCGNKVNANYCSNCGKKVEEDS